MDVRTLESEKNSVLVVATSTQPVSTNKYKT